MMRFPTTSTTTNNKPTTPPTPPRTSGCSTRDISSIFWRKPRKNTDGSHVSITSAATACSSPLRARSSSEHGNVPPTNSVPRNRLNSRDIPRTYSGLYGSGGLDGDDLLPFELNRHRAKNFNVFILLGFYITVLAVVQLISMLLLTDVQDSWTLTNAIHAVSTIMYIHWFKGSMYLDDSGEMDALTLWEQLEATQGTRHVRETLMVMPCLLAWVACHAADYQKLHSTVNIVLWIVSMIGKLPFMNGVRLFGINRTAGIDDAFFSVPPKSGVSLFGDDGDISILSGGPQRKATGSSTPPALETMDEGYQQPSGESSKKTL